MPRNRWALLWWDDYAAVFARRDRVDAAWLKEREFVFLRPGDAEAAALLLCTGEFNREDLEAERKRIMGMRAQALPEEREFGWFLDEYPASCKNLLR